MRRKKSEIMQEKIRSIKLVQVPLKYGNNVASSSCGKKFSKFSHCQREHFAFVYCICWLVERIAHILHNWNETAVLLRFAIECDVKPARFEVFLKHFHSHSPFTLFQYDFFHDSATFLPFNSIILIVQ